jgi:hypothetical protein
MKLKLYQGIHTVINKLIEFDPKYKEEDLTSLYMGTNQFEKKVLH